MSNTKLLCRCGCVALCNEEYWMEWSEPVVKKKRRLPAIKFSDKVAQNILYAAPMIASSSLFTPINIVQGIYAKHYGLGLTTIAGIILFARLFDAITDPIIGYLSDKSRVKTGTRKPTMILGAIVLSSSGYFLYSPPDEVSALYFAFWFMVFYLGFTLFYIPHLAWGGEMSHGTHEKTQIYTLRTVASYIGVVLFYSLPLLPIWETTEITPDTLKVSAIVSGLLMLPLLYLCMTRVPDGRCFSEEKSGVDKLGKSGQASFGQFFNTVKNVVDNKPLLLLLGAFLFAGSGLGMWYGLLFIYVDAYLGMGALFAKIYLIALVVSISGAFIWLGIAKHLGKKYTWLLVMLLGIASFAYSGFLGPENTDFWALLILLLAITLCFIGIESLPQSMLSDIVDYANWKFRTYRGSTYFALFMFTYKGSLAVGGALGLAIAGGYGFDPSSTSQTDAGITGLTVAMTWVPALLVVISMIFIALSPITARRHSIIRRRLDGIEARSKMVDKNTQAIHKVARETLLTAN